MRHLWLCGLLFIGACGIQEDAISQMVQIPITTAVPVVKTAQARKMLDFMIPPKMLPQGTTTARWDQCLIDKEDVRAYFPPRMALVEITPEMIRLSGQPLIGLEDYSPAKEAVRGQLLVPLFDAASQMAHDAKRAGSTEGCWPHFEGRVLIAHHPDVPFSVLRKVMYTLGQAQFSDFYWLVVVGTEGSASAAAYPPVNAHSIVTVRPSTLPAIGAPSP